MEKNQKNLIMMRAAGRGNRRNEYYKRGFLMTKYCTKLIYLVVDLDEEELDKGISLGTRVNPE